MIINMIISMIINKNENASLLSKTFSKRSLIKMQEKVGLTQSKIYIQMFLFIDPTDRAMFID